MSKPLTMLRKSPTQPRATATFDAIITAAAHILGREGPDALTTNGIAERAGVSIGSVYQYFPNKQAIVRALLEREIKGAEALRPALLDDPSAPPESVVRAAVDWWFAMHAADPALARHVSALSALLPAAERARLAQLKHERLRRTVARLLDDDARLDEAVFVFEVCLAALSAQAQKHHPDWLTSESFRREVALLLTRYARS